MDFTYLDSLNSDQRAAVEHGLGAPAMVLAGAGSGKTKVLTTRVAHLIRAHGVQSHEILLVTFTNKAAQEMSKRVESLVGAVVPFAGTFHRLCAKILRRHGTHLGLPPDFSIYDDEDQLSLISAIIKGAGLSSKEVKPRAVLSMIGEAKNAMVTPEQYRQTARGRYQEIVARLYPLYQEQLLRNAAVDFDDLLLCTVDVLSKNVGVRDSYRSTFSHILIDEYQDTNTAQLALTKLLLNDEKNLFVVGDFSQAIYSWRGADYRNMLSLTQTYPEMQTYKLSQNYRSTQAILDVASSIIAQNTTHPVLSLWTEKESGKKVELYEGESDKEEVSFVVSSIEKILRFDQNETVAIVYRTNAQSRAFEERLLSFGIPYRLVGGTRFYARKEIKDVLAYIRLWVRPTDAVSRQRVEKLGKRKAAVFFSWVETVQKEQKESVLILVDFLLQQAGYLELFDDHDEDDRTRLENIQELRSVCAQYTDVTQFLESVSLIEEEAMRTQSSDDARVVLLSIHASKGLEFDHVFVVGMEEGLFPHSRSLLDRHQMEEERRLCYVACTRAKKELHLSYARKRLTYGTIAGSIVSRFIGEVPTHLLERNGGGMKSYSQQHVSYEKTRFVPFDDPSIDDFLQGDMDIDTFLRTP